VRVVLKGFRDFISRGNVIELAVGVVMGVAFNNLVTNFTESFLEPLIRRLGGVNVGGKGIGIGGGEYLNWASFVNAIITFLLTAMTVYFLLVLPMNKLAERRKRGIEPEPESVSDTVRLLTEIRDALVAGGGKPVAAGARSADGGAPADEGKPVKPE
jgi:large conductance mechanosensitive channel